MPKPTRRPHELTPFVDEFTMPQVLNADTYDSHQLTYPRLRLTLNTTEIQLHSALPSFQIQCYNNQFPGPTIEVRRGQTIHVEWIDTPQIRSGTNGVNELVSPAMHTIVSTYTNEQPATVMGYRSDGFNNARGYSNESIVGMWLIRDAHDDAVLAALNKYELLLFIQDCQLASTSDAILTAQLTPNPATMTHEYSDPYTLVNGRIWPYAEIQARPYRLRLVNGSHAQELRLVFFDEQDNSRNDIVQQIGNAKGLVDIPHHFAASHALLLAPSSSADILVDFSVFRGKRVHLANTLAASSPQVMEFRVSSKDSGKSFTTLNLPPLK